MYNQTTNFSERSSEKLAVRNVFIFSWISPLRPTKMSYATSVPNVSRAVNRQPGFRSRDPYRRAWLDGLLAGWLSVLLAGWLIGWLVGLLADWLSDLAGQKACLLACRIAGFLTWWLAGLLTCWLSDFVVLTCWLLSFFSFFPAFLHFFKIQDFWKVRREYIFSFVNWVRSFSSSNQTFNM